MKKNNKIYLGTEKINKLFSFKKTPMSTGCGLASTTLEIKNTNTNWRTLTQNDDVQERNNTQVDKEITHSFNIKTIDIEKQN